MIKTDELLGYAIRTSAQGDFEPFCAPCAGQYIDWTDAWAEHARSHNLGCAILASDLGVACLCCVRCGYPLLETVSSLLSDTATACVNAAANDKRPGR